MSELEEKLNAILSSPEQMQQIAQLAQTLSGQSVGPSPAQRAPEPPPAAAGGMDLSSLARILPLLQASGTPQNDARTQLLYALKPFLKPERQAKIDHALQLARLLHTGKILFSGLGEVHV